MLVVTSLCQHAAHGAKHAVARSRQTQRIHSRSFKTSTSRAIVKPFLLADIGEGITECQLIQWFVEPGARVEQFDKLCEVQSDKASVEITSPYDGVVKKLHYEPDDMAITGKALLDIDVIGQPEEQEVRTDVQGPDMISGTLEGQGIVAEGGETGDANVALKQTLQQGRPRQGSSDHSTLATPAVRHLMKQLKVDIADVPGTGRDGRVLKEDVHRYAASQRESTPSPPTVTPQRLGDRSLDDARHNLTPVQTQMFRMMTRSLSIPHFLYTCTADMTSTTSMRAEINASSTSDKKLTQLPFIVKAVSLAFQHHSLLNSALDTKDPKAPVLTQRKTHNFGIAVDAPSGLVVPVLRDVQDLSIEEIATGIRGLSQKAREGKLSPSDFSGASFTISNVGNIGGGVVSPVISEPQVAILGIGRSKIVPAYDDQGELVKKEELVFSWSADHRVVDGAEAARCAEKVKDLLETPGAMLVGLR